MLTQIFGNTTHAIATVLSPFMASLAVGSYAFGRLVDRNRDALLAYGLLEGGVGLYGLLVPTLFALTQRAYIYLYNLVEVSSAVFSVVLFLLSFLVIVIPTALMGATLPVLSRFSGGGSRVLPFPTGHAGRARSDRCPRDLDGCPFSLVAREAIRGIPALCPGGG